MRWFRFAVLILIATLLQAGLLVHLSIKPDLLLILLVFFAIYCNTSEVIITSFTIGFAADIIGVGSSMGPRIISFGLFGTLLSEMYHVVTIRKWPYQSLAIFITGFLTAALAYLLTFLKVIFFEAEPVALNTYTELFWTPLYSAIVGPLLFLPTQWWMRIRTHRFSRR